LLDLGQARSYLPTLVAGGSAALPALPEARITALCEVDRKHLAPQVEKLKTKGVTPFTASDPRRALERDDVDAVIIATPNHWHALLTAWALRAGKDVYMDLWCGPAPRQPLT
jgi:predicted dehydrogenase